MFTLQSFIQAHITHVTMKRLVTVDSTERIKGNYFTSDVYDHFAENRKAGDASV